MGHADTMERLFLQASPGLESVLELEARALGRARRVAGGVELEGPRGVHAEANLVLRIAERVLLRLLEAPARSWGEALEALGNLRLAEGRRPRAPVPTRGAEGVSFESVALPGTPVVLESSVRLPGAPRSAEGVATALARAWRRPVSSATGVEREGDPPRLVLRAAEGGVQLSVDTSDVRLGHADHRGSADVATHGSGARPPFRR
jgi:hypothetical protein